MSGRCKRVHIVGCSPRSGTTLLTEMMVNAFRIDGFAEHELSIYNWPKREHECIVTKHPLDVLTVRPLLDHYPDLHVVCVIRDPRDVVVSRHGRASEQYYVGLNTWRACYPAFQRFRDHPRVMAVRYEDLVADPDAVQAEIVRRIPFLETLHPFSDYHAVARPSEQSSLALGALRPPSTSSIGRWRENKPRLAGQLARHGPITGDLIELGYEKDASWLAELEGVEPDLSDSVHSEGWPDDERWRLRLWRWRNTLRCFLGAEHDAELERPAREPGSREA